ncbi:hypothetical protein PVAP13_3KG452301 [Panicum virgatum]|uniref:Uncharacterized protein n=1 Tax=Panicum virgatum TaxID=38727 RepID=A0A8T0V5G4_PANVG|nr:hypothetical protein PVAP13_3KG452301 [Panicum virgatum]
MNYVPLCWVDPEAPSNRSTGPPRSRPSSPPFPSSFIARPSHLLQLRRGAPRVGGGHVGDVRAVVRLPRRRARPRRHAPAVRGLQGQGAQHPRVQQVRRVLHQAAHQVGGSHGGGARGVFPSSLPAMAGSWRGSGRCSSLTSHRCQQHRSKNNG